MIRTMALTAAPFAVDVGSLPSATQTVAFLVLGVSLVVVAWLYARFSPEVPRWL